MKKRATRKTREVISPYPFQDAMKPWEVFGIQCTTLAKRLSKIGMGDVTIGISGGLDSTLCLLVADAAFRILSLDRARIHVYSMPGFGTTTRTKRNAEMLCRGLGIKLETIDIKAACRRHFRDIGHDPKVHDVVFENAQARYRTMILMDKANQTGGIVLGTGDMSEIALGWSTYNGDHMSMYGVNAGVPKTVVRDVCRWWAEKNGGEASRAIRRIIATPVSPELLPGGAKAQKTEDKIGPYELHDFFMWRVVVNKERKRFVQAAAEKAFRKTYDSATIKKWLDLFAKRIVTQAFKRNCAPDGIKVFPVYFGPHDWWIPSDLKCCGRALDWFGKKQC